MVMADLYDIALTQPAYTYSVDVNGNDNAPEWGFCTVQGCREAAYPIWYSGGFPDEPDLLFCDTHIGARIATLERALKEILVPARWLSIGTIDNVAELRIGRVLYERAQEVAYNDKKVS